MYFYKLLHLFLNYIYFAWQKCVKAINKSQLIKLTWFLKKNQRSILHIFKEVSDSQLVGPGNSICICWSSDFFDWWWKGFPHKQYLSIHSNEIESTGWVAKLHSSAVVIGEGEGRVPSGQFSSQTVDLLLQDFTDDECFKCFWKLMNKFQGEDSTMFVCLLCNF